MMRIFLKKVPCDCPYDHDRRQLVIATDGWPLEMIKGHTIINFLRRILHGDHIEGHECYERRNKIKVSSK